MLHVLSKLQIITFWHLSLGAHVLPFELSRAESNLFCI